MISRRGACLAMLALLAATFIPRDTMAIRLERLPRGMVRERPRRGHYVEYQGAFLVPYELTIPGTTARIQMIPVPAGVYRLTWGDESGEMQTRDVHVVPFWISRTEVTWGQFQSYMDLDRHFREFAQLKWRPVDDEHRVDAMTAPSEFYDVDFRRNHNGGSPQHPVGGVAAFGARSYTQYLSRLTGEVYRLPSAIEWQYAALGEVRPSNRVEQREEDLKAVAWFSRNAGGRQIVGQKEPNAWGLHDMAGNVSEWVLDGSLDDLRQLGKRLHGKMKVDSIDAVAWPTQHRARMALGGSYLDAAADCQIDSALFSTDALYNLEPMLPPGPHWTTSDQGQAIGFRILRPVKERLTRMQAKQYWEPDHPEVEKTLQQKLESGYVVEGRVDKELPRAIQALKQRRQR
jgi:sulfatase modifying factor 1